MSNTSPPRLQRALVTCAVASLLLATSEAPRAEAATVKSCTAYRQRMIHRELASELRCLAREQRSRNVAPACRRRAAAAMESVLRRRPACGNEASPVVDAVDRCTSMIVEQLSDGGRCRARKLSAVAKSLLHASNAQGGHSRGAALCRAFERAGSCAGNCPVVQAALASCLAAGAAGGLPAAAPDDEVILFGAYEGDAISSTTIDGQDEETETARVVIEPGTTPLYVLLTSYERMIWRFEGAISRVHEVVLLGRGPRGVTGIAADRVANLVGTEGPLAEYFYSQDSSEAVRQAVEEGLGRAVDIVTGTYSVGTLSLPSATTAPSAPPVGVPPGFDPGVYQLGLWFNPGGVIDIDPSQVVATAPATPYEVLPDGFGLAQLVATGALEQRDGVFYIARPIPRFPAGLYGAHAVAFVLGTGVPMPAGSPGHSCVISEETGLPLTQPALCGIYEVPPVTCDLPAAPEADQIMVFGTYEGDAISAVTIAGQDEVTDTARVVVAPGDTPLYLVLASYETSLWRFEGATSRIDHLVLTGYGAQGATGIPAARITNLSASTSCRGYFYDVQSPEAVAVRHGVEDALGRAVDVFAGSYSVGTLAVPSAAVEPSVPSSTVPPGFDADAYEQLGLRFNPGGVVDIDPSLVVSTNPPEPYDVLPYGFGLAQLIARGDLELRGSDPLFDGYVYIARAIARFPAGLYGAHAVTFVLGTGLPLPPGSPGHSCVISEETGRPVADDSIANLLCSGFPGLGN